MYKKNKWKVYGLFLAFILANVYSISAQQNKNKNFVFVSNDYRELKSGKVLIKFFSEELKYSQGYNIYRKKEGNNDLVKINKSPIVFLKTLPSYIKLEGENAEMYTNFLKFEAATMNAEPMVKAIVKLKAVQNFNFAIAIGQAFIDSAAIAGETYQYIVRKVSANTDLLIGNSLSLKVETWKQDVPPQEIKFERLKVGVSFAWLQEPRKHMGVDIYRKRQGDKDFVKITDIPVAPRMRENGKYPKYFFNDQNTASDSVYIYKLATVDYFGQVSLFSEEIKAAKKDFEPPFPPDSVSLDVDTLKIKLAWKTSVSKDLIGFNVYRSKEYAKNFQKVNPKLIPKTQTKFVDIVPKFDEYFYNIAAVDSSGNEGNSMVIMADVRDVLPPEVPKNLKASIEKDKIILTWSPSPDKDLKGYYIYKAPAGGTDFVILNGKPLNQTSFEIPYSKKSKTKFTYKVLAIDSSFNRSAATLPISLQLPDVQAPNQPFIKAIELKNDFPQITWMANVDNDLKSYALIRMKYGKDTLKTVLKNDISKLDTIYTDKTAESNENYKYLLFATDSTGNVSLSSTPYSFKNVNTNTVLKVKKFASKYDKKNKEVKLTWTLETDKNYYGVVVFRAFKEEDMSQLSKKLITETEFVDKTAQKPGQYQYQLRIYDKLGNVVRSELQGVIVQ